MGDNSVFQKQKTAAFYTYFLFQTTDWTVHSSVMLKDTIIMAGFPPQFTAEQIQAKFPEKISKGISKVSFIVVNTEYCMQGL